MEATLREQYLLMTLYLINKISNMRQGVLEKNDIAIIYPDILNDIISKIKQQYHIDCNNLSNNEDYLHAEKALSNFITTLSAEDLSTSAKEEVSLMKDSLDLTKEDFIEAPVDLANGVKDLFSKLGITNINLTKKWFTSPDYARYFQIDENENILLTKVVTISGIKKILFAHISINRDRNKRITLYQVVNALLVNYQKFKDMLSSPIRLYLFLLDEYGFDITFNGITKKLFYKIEESKETEISIQTKNAKHYYIGLQKHKGKDNKEYFMFIQGFNYDLYMKDYLNNII